MGWIHSQFTLCTGGKAQFSGTGAESEALAGGICGHSLLTGSVCSVKYKARLLEPERTTPRSLGSGFRGRLNSLLSPVVFLIFL